MIREVFPVFLFVAVNVYHVSPADMSCLTEDLPEGIDDTDEEEE